MTKRILLAGVLAGIAMFLWSGLAHDVLFLGRTGIQELPNEATVLGPMQSTLGSSSGLYIYPGLGLGPNPTREQEKAAMAGYQAKLAANPSGLLIYHPSGGEALSSRQLITEFLTELVEAFLAVFLLARARIGSFVGRVGFVTVIGILAAITTNVPYWNWYGFPVNYTFAYMSIEIIGFLVAGLVAAAIVKNEPVAQKLKMAA